MFKGTQAKMTHNITLRAWSVGCLVNNHTFFNVRHVFNKTVYLEGENNDLIILSAYEWRAPFIVNVHAEEITSFKQIVKPEEKVIVDRESFVFKESGLIVKLEGSEYYAGLEPPESISPLGLPEINRLLGILVLLSTCFEDSFWSRERKMICNALLSGETLSEHTMMKIVGLGGGFTPSGDDFYTGYLASLVYHEKVRGRSNTALIIPDVVLNRTTWASRRLIQYAAKGIFDEAIEELLKNMYEGSIERTVNSLIQLARRGHTSGFYLAVGLITGFTERVHRNKSACLKRICNA